MIRKPDVYNSELLAVFQAVDTDGSGELTCEEIVASYHQCEEFQQIMKLLQMDPINEQLNN